jgi:pantoate--beta-alanine ligase
MKTINNVKMFKKELSGKRLSGKSIGFVPTMGFFHEGHLSLIRRAREENGVAVVSVFVNPAQFSAGEDLNRYPRDVNRDIELARKERIDYFFNPQVDEMYPDGYKTFVEVESLSRKLCGKSRPGHFKGVATVVAKLLNICRPDVLYLGQKDAQQAVILKRVVADLNMDVNVKVLPTVREKDGLAMSSRNKYLDDDERARAPVLYKALSEAEKSVKEGERDAGLLLKRIRRRISEEKGIMIDYVEAVSIDDLESLDEIKGPALIAGAVKLGGARLIDNVLINCEKL